jgi:hypothetical protein
MGIMQKFIYREGTVRNPKTYTLTLTNEENEVMYERTMTTGIIKNMPHFIKTLIDGAVMFDCYEDGFGDLDMVNQTNGHMLNIEFKGNLHKLLKNVGQLKQAVNMAHTSKVTTFFVEGNSDEPKRIFTVSHFAELNDYTVRELNGIDGLNELIRQWKALVAKQPQIDTRGEYEALKEALTQQLKGGNA